MTLIRWEPVRELSTIQNEMNRLFNTFFDPSAQAAGGAAGSQGARRWMPAMDLVETGEAFVLHADLPGLSEQDVNIELEDGVLTISGERRAEHADHKEGYYRPGARLGFVPSVVDPARRRRPRGRAGEL